MGRDKGHDRDLAPPGLWDRHRPLLEHNFLTVNTGGSEEKRPPWGTYVDPTWGTRENFRLCLSNLIAGRNLLLYAAFRQSDLVFRLLLFVQHEPYRFFVSVCKVLRRPLGIYLRAPSITTQLMPFHSLLPLQLSTFH